MIRFLRIVCVTCITVIMTLVLLLIKNSISLFEWINYTKIGMSGLIISLIYLLLDKKRNTLIGKTSLSAALLSSTLLLSSILVISLNNYWNITFGLIIFSFTLVLFSKYQLKNIAEKSIFYSAFLIPIGIICSIENRLFYMISTIVLIILSVTALVFSFKRKEF